MRLLHVALVLASVLLAAGCETLRPLDPTVPVEVDGQVVTAVPCVGADTIDLQALCWTAVTGALAESVADYAEDPRVPDQRAVAAAEAALSTRPVLQDLDAAFDAYRVARGTAAEIRTEQELRDAIDAVIETYNALVEVFQ